MALAQRVSSNPWRWLGWGAVALGIGALLTLLWSAWGHDVVTNWMRNADPVWFFLVMAVLPAVGVPFTPLFVLAGATFGTRAGLIGSLSAIAANVTLCYWIARSGLRPLLEKLLRRIGHEFPDFRANDRSALRFTLVMKLAPGVPLFVKNYALGGAGVPFGTYFAASMMITGAYALAFVVVGESVLDHDLRSLLVLAGAVVVVASGVWWWRKRRRPAA